MSIKPSPKPSCRRSFPIPRSFSRLRRSMWTATRCGSDGNSGAQFSIWDRNATTRSSRSISSLKSASAPCARPRPPPGSKQAAEASFKDARRTLDLGVTKAYIAALLAQANVRIIHQTMESLLHEGKIAETRLAAGDISKSDKAQIEIAAARAELDAEAALSTAKTARIAVEVLLGSERRTPQGEWMPGDSTRGPGRFRESVTTGASGNAARPARGAGVVAKGDPGSEASGGDAHSRSDIHRAIRA